MKISAHTKRILTSVLLLPLIIWVVFWGGSLGIHLLVLVVSFLGVWEFLSLFELTYGPLFLLKCTGLILTIPLVFSDYLHISPLFLLIGCFWILNLCFLFSYGGGGGWKWTYFQLVFLSLVYIPLVLHFFVYLSPWEIFYVVGLAFISDTCAFYVGSRWGKKRLWPVISPKKSWAGAWGSMGGAVIFSLLCAIPLLSYSWYKALFLGILLNLCAQIGDLFESAIKRYLEVKDAGNLLPGHGGMLDRIDSLLFVSAMYFILGSMVR